MKNLNGSSLFASGAAAFVLLGAVVLPLGACSSSSSADTGPLTDFLQAQAQASCNWEFKCCTDAEIKTIDDGKYKTAADCVAYAQLASEDSLYLAKLAVSEGRLKVDSTHATACISQLNARVCNSATPTTTTPPTTTATDDCALALVGNTPVGSECVYAQECVKGAHCVNDSQVEGRGVCVPYQEVGSICDTDTDCDPTVSQIYCAAEDFKCHVRGKAGDPCAYTLTTTVPAGPTLPLLLECDDTPSSALYCDPISSTCKTLPGAGEACLLPLPPGVSEACNPDPTLDLTCATTTTGTGTGTTTTGTCRAPGKIGDSCATLPCAADLYCQISGTTEVCAALPGLGQPCAGAEQQCAKPYYCKFDTTTDTETCTAPAELGQDCSTVTCDTGLYCNRTGTTSLCATQLPDGSPCSPAIAEECLSDFCSGTPTTCQPVTTGLVCIGR